jgi:hypothetical protein
LRGALVRSSADLLRLESATSSRLVIKAAGGLLRPHGISRIRLRVCGEMCKVVHMATNLAIDDGLLRKAQKVGGQRTKKATVTEALLEYIQHREQQKVVSLFGTVEWDKGYDYKRQRRRA